VIQLIFRKRDQQSFSIERVFGAVIPWIGKLYRVEVQEAQTRSAGLLSILRNLVKLRNAKGDIYHVTGDIHYAVFAFPKRRTILTIHDCVFLNNSSGVKRWLFKKIWLQWPVRYARVITTISEKSKSEIIQHSGCDPKKIKVIPDPVPTCVQFQRKEFNKEKPLILFIGTKPNKNLFRAISSLEGIKCELEIVGRLSQEQIAALQQSRITYRNYVGITDLELAKRYSNCDLVLYPSTYEGFGLPVLEAQQAGRPVIASDISPLKDVAGNGACLVNPYEVKSIREGILKVIDNDVYRQEIIENGFLNVRNYSQEMVAERYIELYKMIQAD
jgi:glycosyltransferase involved in cell wall biosynthesis